MQDGHMRGAGVRTGKKESMLAGYSVEKGAANGMMDKVNAFQSILSKVVPERECLNQIKERKMRKLKHKRRKKNEEMCIGLSLAEEGGRCFLINLFKSTAQEASCRTEKE